MDLPALFAAVEAGEKAINVDLSTTETYRDIMTQTAQADAHDCIYCHARP